MKHFCTNTNNARIIIKWGKRSVIYSNFEKKIENILTKLMETEVLGGKPSNLQKITSKNLHRIIFNYYCHFL